MKLGGATVGGAELHELLTKEATRPLDPARTAGPGRKRWSLLCAYLIQQNLPHKRPRSGISAAEIAEIDAEIDRLERLIDALRGDIRLLEDERDEIQGQLDLFELELEDAP